MEKINVLLADDHENVRRGLRRMLNRSPQVEVIGEAENGQQALDLTHELNPDVLLLDVEMPDIKGFEVTRRLTDSEAPVKVLALSGYNELRFVLRMFAYGAVGYMTKVEAPGQLINAIKEIAAGRRGWVSPKVAEKLRVYTNLSKTEAALSLTKLEKQILRKVAAGMSDFEISDELELEPAVLMDHIKRINQKMGVSSRLEAVLLAVQEDLIWI